MNQSTWDRIKDGLSLLVLPLIVWGVHLETTMAVQHEKIQSLEAKIEATDKTITAIEKTVRENSLELVKVSGKLDSANEKIDVIKDLLTNKP